MTGLERVLDTHQKVIKENFACPLTSPVSSFLKVYVFPPARAPQVSAPINIDSSVVRSSIFFQSPILKLLSLFSAIPWHNGIMPTRSSKDHDFTTIARRVVEQAIGEKLTGEPLDDPNAGKNPAAVALGRLGGKKGGKARAEALSPEKRKAIAQQAARTRWGKG